MRLMDDMAYLRLNKFQKILLGILNFFVAIPYWFLGIGKKIWNGIKALGYKIKEAGLIVYEAAAHGSWRTRLSFVIMGSGNLLRGQILRGILFLGFQVIFILYMIFSGGYWLSKFSTLGNVAPDTKYDPIYDVDVFVPGDNSFKILLYGILTLFFIIAFIFTWYLNVKNNKINDDIVKSGKKVKSGKEDLKSLVDDQFHKTLLALPLTGILIFTVLPIVFMILVAFTSYDGAHDGYANLFTWVGLNNFNGFISFGSGNGKFMVTFGEILSWTLIWAFFATFTNYFLGMGVAMIINKKGIKLKKLWRTVLVITIAVPQFISLLYISKLFSDNGIVNGILVGLGFNKVGFFTDPTLAKVMVILINIWVGIPYLMLITTGVLMNIPADLYESAKIDGANVWHQYTKITLPYMLFVTGPYLLTSFVSNINNFNVIYLLTKGEPKNPNLPVVGGASAGHTDLLITWLFNITTGTDNDFKMASVIGIFIFLVVAVLSLIVYNLMPSIKNEEDFS